jgi:3-oxoacyl-[acyl-carrier protein] reductase
MPGAEMFAAPEAGFDVFHPAWPAELVAFLASEEAGDVTGQGFIVWGGNVVLVKGWHQVQQLAKADAAFTADELAARKDELFGAHGRRPEWM